MTDFRWTRSVLAPAALASLLLAADASSQTRGGMGGGNAAGTPVRAYGFVGWAPLELDELNARLASLAEPYSAVGEDMALLGGGAQLRMSRLLVGGEGGVMISTEDAEFRDVRRARFAGFWGALTFGAAIIQTDGLDIYPLVQLGGAGATLEIKERGEPAWDDMLAQPGQETILSTASLYGAAGLGIDYAFSGGFFMGLRGTWAWTPPSDDWDAEGTEVLGGPEVDLSGPSVRLLIGFGGRGR